MDEMQFDRTRRAIGSDKLQDKDRQQLIQKFTSAGGQVMDERALRREAERAEKARAKGGAAGEEDKRARNLTGPRLPSQVAREQKFAEADQIQKIRRIRAEEEREASSFVSRLVVKLRCKFKNIVPFGKDRVLPEFMSRLNLDARRAVMECNILSMDLFSTNPEIGRQIIKDLDSKNPLYVEILDRAGKLYDRAELSDLLSAYTSDPTASAAFDGVRVPAISFLKKLYYLRPYQETYLVAAQAAIELQEKLEKKPSNLYAAKKKKIRQEWRTLMDDIFPLLVLLLQRMELKKVEPGTWLFEEIIQANPDERPGRRRAGEPISDLQAKQAEQKAAEEKQEDPDEEKIEDAVLEDGEEKPASDSKETEIAYGMTLMSQIPIENMKRKFDVRGEWKLMQNRDKVFLAYLFFKEFEDEYSMILTSSKVRLNANYGGGVKIDYRQKLADAYETARSAHDQFRKYVQENMEYRRAANDPVAHTNYVEHAKRVQLIEARRGATGRQVRQMIKDVMLRVTSNLEVILDDLKG
ncbi:MAG TPA: hypothetical protein PKA91_07005, partial [Leptospiraceae bacterium]|nr:hypothetical protein [Leptospiraceae bacterium]